MYDLREELDGGEKGGNEAEDAGVDYRGSVCVGLSSVQRGYEESDEKDNDEVDQEHGNYGNCSDVAQGRFESRRRLDKG